MVNLYKKCLDFIARMADSINELFTNPAVSPDEAVRAAAEGMTKALQTPGIRDRIGTFIRNSYLSAMSTQAINFVNNLVPIITSPIIRTLSGKPREGLAMLEGITEGFLEAFPRFFAGLSKRTEDFDGNTHKAFDIVRNKYADAALTYPQRLTGALDQAFSAVLERMEFKAMLHRIKNSFPDEYFTRNGLDKTKFVQELEQVALKRGDGNLSFLRLLENQSPELYQQLQEFAAFGTFRTPLGRSLLDKMGKTVSEAKNVAPELNLVVPFVRTGINVAKYAGGFIPGLGQLRVRQAKKDIELLDSQINSLLQRETKAKEKANQALFPGQAESWRAKAQAFETRRRKLEGTRTFKEEQIPEFYVQQVVGAGMMLSTYGLVNAGLLTGHYSSDPATRQKQMASGMREMSIKVGDRWISYDRIEPFSTVMGLVADGMTALKEGRMKGESPGVGDISKIVGRNLLDKTFTEGLGKMFLAVQEPDRYLESYLVSLTNPLVPAIVNQAARLRDPLVRETKDPELADWMLNNIKARIPGLREQLPARPDVLGQEQPLYGVSTGIAVAPVNQDEVRALLDNPYLTMDRPDRKIGGIELDMEQFAELEQRVGQRVYEVFGMMAANPGFASVPKSLQAKFLKEMVTEIRQQERLATLGTLIQDPALRAQYMLKEMEKMGFGSLVQEDEE